MTCDQCGFARNEQLPKCAACAAQQEREESRRDAVRAHMDRRAPRCCMSCGALDVELCDVSCDVRAIATARKWGRWFADGNYLGLARSARVGPDPVEVPEKQKCGCGQCMKSNESET